MHGVKFSRHNTTVIISYNGKLERSVQYVKKTYPKNMKGRNICNIFTKEVLNNIL